MATPAPAALLKEPMATLATLDRLLAARLMVVPVAAVSVPVATLESVADEAMMEVVLMLLILERVD